MQRMRRAYHDRVPIGNGKDHCYGHAEHDDSVDEEQRGITCAKIRPDQAALFAERDEILVHEQGCVEVGAMMQVRCSG